jgi:4-aminobutyrate aminotransferase-like enzyme
LTLDKGVNGPPAGVVVEPLQASAGMIPCPKRYLQRVREICDKHETPLIFDEIQTYIRIGSFFAAQHYDVTPDVIALGKAVGGGLPLGATLVRDGLAGFEPDAEELHTFAANTLSMVGAIKLIEIVQRDRLLEHANAMGERLRRGLVELQKEFPEIGDIRQVGLHIGIEMVADPQGKRPLDQETRKIRDAAMARGVIFGLAGVRKNLLKIKPPLVIQPQEADEVLGLLRDALQEVLRA